MSLSWVERKDYSHLKRLVDHQRNFWTTRGNSLKSSHTENASYLQKKLSCFGFLLVKMKGNRGRAASTSSWRKRLYLAQFSLMYSTYIFKCRFERSSKDFEIFSNQSHTKIFKYAKIPETFHSLILMQRKLLEDVCSQLKDV